MLVCTFSFTGPLLLVLEFCSRGTLESNLRDNIKSEQMFLKKKKMQLANEIAKGMRHLSDARVNSLLVFQKNITLKNN
jgi:hypothetical protein